MESVSAKDSHEYLEGLFERAFEREIEQEERIFDSLPFMVAAIAITANLLNFIFGKLPTFHSSIYCVSIYTLASVDAVMLAICLIYLGIGVWPKTYRLPPKETETLSWFLDLNEYYRLKRVRGQALKDAVALDLHRRSLTEFAEAAVHNRALNANRVLARSRSINLLVWQFGLAFGIVSIMFVHDRIVPSGPGGADNVRSAKAAPTAAQASAHNAAPETAASKAAIHYGGVATTDRAKSRKAMTDGSTTPSPAPAPAPAATPAAAPASTQTQVRPAAPAPQYFKKSD